MSTFTIIKIVISILLGIYLVAMIAAAFAILKDNIQSHNK